LIQFGQLCSQEGVIGSHGQRGFAGRFCLRNAGGFAGGRQLLQRSRILSNQRIVIKQTGERCGY
jgi:hypothetical protein